MDDGERGLLILALVAALAAWGHWGPGSLVEAVRVMLWPDDDGEKRGGPLN